VITAHRLYLTALHHGAEPAPDVDRITS